MAAAYQRATAAAEKAAAAAAADAEEAKAAATNGVAPTAASTAPHRRRPQLSVRAHGANGAAAPSKLIVAEKKREGKMGSPAAPHLLPRDGLGRLRPLLDPVRVVSYGLVAVTDYVLSVWSSSANGLGRANDFFLTLFLGLAGVQILVMLATSIVGRSTRSAPRATSTATPSRA